MTGYEVRPAVASRDDIDWLLERLEDPDFGNGATAPTRGRARGRRRAVDAARRRRPAGPLYDMRDNAPINFGAAGEDASVIQLVHRVIKEAVERGVSDIHFEPRRRGACASATASTACSSEAAIDARAAPSRPSPRA